jgi:hypothetical protein
MYCTIEPHASIYSQGGFRLWADHWGLRDVTFKDRNRKGWPD